jgi:hypothetical protein
VRQGAEEVVFKVGEDQGDKVLSFMDTGLYRKRNFFLDMASLACSFCETSNAHVSRILAYKYLLLVCRSRATMITPRLPIRPTCVPVWASRIQSG